MTTHRGWYVAGLVAAVLALALSVGAAAALVTHRTGVWGAPAASAEDWRSGAGGGLRMGPHAGMMGGWDDDQATITAEQATATAQAWVDAHESGATLGLPALMPRGYLFTVIRDGQVIGTVMVDDDTGRLVWRGAVQPSAPTSAS